MHFIVSTICRYAIMVLCLGSLLACSSMTRALVPDSANEPAETEHTESVPVVLLHGLRRSARSMNKIAHHLKSRGFEVCNVNYPTNRAGVSALADHIEAEIYACFGDHKAPLNFVTHSLGGIMVRVLAASKPDEIDVGRVVMLAPPNKGSEIVDDLAGYWIFKKVMGEIATELGTDAKSLPNSLGPATFDVGVVAGVGHSNPMGWFTFDEPNDGTVSVESVRLSGMVDFIEVPFGHSFIMRKQPIINEAEHFLRHGQFSDFYRSK